MRSFLFWLACIPAIGYAERVAAGANSAPAALEAQEWKSVGAAASAQSNFSMSSAWWLSSGNPASLANCFAQPAGGEIDCFSYALPPGKWTALNAAQTQYQLTSIASLWLYSQSGQSGLLMCSRFLHSADAITCVAAALPQAGETQEHWHGAGSAASLLGSFSVSSAWFYTQPGKGSTPQQVLHCASTPGPVQIDCKAFSLPAASSASGWEPVGVSQSAYQGGAQSHLWLKSAGSTLICRRFLSNADTIACTPGRLPPL
jgi:hypothetical protein